MRTNNAPQLSGLPDTHIICRGGALLLPRIILGGRRQLETGIDGGLGGADTGVPLLDCVRDLCLYCEGTALAILQLSITLVTLLNKLRFLANLLFGCLSNTGLLRAIISTQLCVEMSEGVLRIYKGSNKSSSSAV